MRLIDASVERRAPLLLSAAFALASCTTEGGFDSPVRYAVEGEAIPAPLAGPGDAARGRQIVLDRQYGCVLCHVVPASHTPAGNVGPPLERIGSRLGEGQLRLRIVDSQRINPDTVMPPYYRTAGLYRVASGYRGRPVLDAQQVEDVVAYLKQLR